ncbi:uncharacterized protein ACB057_011202 [Neosynchiropus ocellatus]
MPQQNQTHEAVASLKLELVAAIRGAFEVAVEIAVREVTELVGQTTDKYLEVMRKENESLGRRRERGKDYIGHIVDRGRIEFPESQRYLKNNSKPINDSGYSAAGQSTMDPNSVSTRHLYLSMKDKSKRTSPFRCTICNRGFNHMMNLKTHLRIHTGERPYTCPICSRCFRHSNALTRHVRIHTGEKPYNCGWCGKSFRHLAGLKIHQRSHK